MNLFRVHDFIISKHNKSFSPSPTWAVITSSVESFSFLNKFNVTKLKGKFAGKTSSPWSSLGKWSLYVSTIEGCFYANATICQTVRNKQLNAFVFAEFPSSAKDGEKYLFLTACISHIIVEHVPCSLLVNPFISCAQFSWQFHYILSLLLLPKCIEIRKYRVIILT